MQRMQGIRQLSIRSGELGRLALMVAKVTEEFLVGVPPGNILTLIRKPRETFKIEKVIIEKPFFFSECEVAREPNGDVTLSMKEYTRHVKEIQISHAGRKETNEKASENETTMFRGVVGTLLWLGKGIIAPASYAGSKSQQRFSDLKLVHLTETHHLMRCIAKLQPHIVFKFPQSK